MTDRPNLTDALADHYQAARERAEKQPPKQERWAPGADPLGHVRRMAEIVETSPGYAATLSARDRAAVSTFLTRKAHLKATTDTTDTNGDDQ